MGWAWLGGGFSCFKALDVLSSSETGEIAAAGGIKEEPGILSRDRRTGEGIGKLTSSDLSKGRNSGNIFGGLE